jgi:hypothetical protein
MVNMNRKIIKILLFVSILALLISACDSQAFPTADQIEEKIGNLTPTGTPSVEGQDAMLDKVNPSGPVLPENEQALIGDELASGIEPATESLNTSNQAMPEGAFVGQEGADIGESVEVNQAVMDAPIQSDASESVNPNDIPSLEERDAMLDGVNRGGLVFSESEQAPVNDGPAPGTESVQGPAGVLGDILDWVNRGGPVLTGGKETTGNAPAPGTESYNDNTESTPGTTGQTVLPPWQQFVELLRAWLQGIFN